MRGDTSPFGDQVILVTGSSRGLGLAIAERFLALGAHVVGTSRTDTALVDDRYRHITTDLTSEGAPAEVVRSAYRTRGRLDIVVNNAGAARMNAVLLTPDTAVQDLLALNFQTTFAVSREAARLMRRRNYGRIINMSSVAVPMALEGEAAYAASKAAIESFTRILAREVAAFGITCNAVAPSPVATDLTRSVPAAAMERLLGRLALKRMATTREVAYAVEALAHPNASAITGQIVYLGGPA